MKDAAQMEALFERAASIAAPPALKKRILRDHEQIRTLASQPGEREEDIFDSVAAHFTMARLRSILRREKEAFAATDAYVSQFPGIRGSYYSALVLVNSPAFTCVLSVLDPTAHRRHKAEPAPESRTVKFDGGPSCLKVLKGRIPLRIWSITPFDDSTDFARGGVTARPGRSLSLRAGQQLRLNAFEEVEYLPFETPVVAIHTRLTSETVPLAAICEARSGTLMRTQAVGQEPSRLQMLATLLRMLGDPAAFDAIEELLADRRHFVRWHAMRELIRLDPERTYPLLKRMSCDDRQPSVRRAAAETLDRYFSQSGSFGARAAARA